MPDGLEAIMCPITGIALSRTIIITFHLVQRGSDPVGKTQTYMSGLVWERYLIDSYNLTRADQVRTLLLVSRSYINKDLE
jgi:hypothetical protein